MEMKPATIVALIVLVALIFIPAMFIDVKQIERDVPPDANGLTPPPYIGAPIPAPPKNAPAPDNEPAPPSSNQQGE